MKKKILTGLIAISLSQYLLAVEIAQNQNKQINILKQAPLPEPAPLPDKNDDFNNLKLINEEAPPPENNNQEPPPEENNNNEAPPPAEGEEEDKDAKLPPHQSPPPPHEPYEIGTHDCDDKKTQLYPPENAEYEEREDGGFNKNLQKDDGGAVKFEAPADGSDMNVKITHGESDKETNFRPPECSDVKFDDDGSFHNRVDKDDFSLELNSTSKGDFEFKYEANDKKPLQLKAPAGSDARIEDDGSFYNYAKLENETETIFKSDTTGSSDFTIKPKGKEPIKIKSPVGLKVDISEDGASEQLLDLGNKKSKVKVDKNGEIEARVEGSEKERFFKPLYGSDIDVTVEGDIESNKSKVLNDSNITASLEIKNEVLSAKIYIQDNSTRKYRDYVDEESYIYVDYTMDVNYLDGGVDIVASWFEDDSSDTLRNDTTTQTTSSNTTDTNLTDLNSGYFDINISTKTNFIFPDKASSSDSVYLDITPNEISSFKQLIYFDSNQSLSLIDGDVNITGSINGLDVNLKNINFIKIDEKQNYQFKNENSSLYIDKSNNIYISVGGYFYHLPKTKEISINQNTSFEIEYLLDTSLYLSENSYLEVINSTRIKESIEEKSKKITLLSGSAKLDSNSLEQNSPIEISNVYITKNETTNEKIELESGWSLKSNPIAEFVTIDKSKHKVFSYQNSNWRENIEYLMPLYGYWIYSDSKTSLDMEGKGYSLNSSFNINNFSKNQWFLLGASEILTPDANSSITYKYKNQNWQKNPSSIESTEGFWLKNK